MKATIMCPRRCGGRVFVEPYIDDSGLVSGYEAKCLACSRTFDLTRLLKQVREEKVA